MALARRACWVCLVGSGGQLDLGQELTAASPLTLFVPQGTRELLVFDAEDHAVPPHSLPFPQGAIGIIE